MTGRKKPTGFPATSGENSHKLQETSDLFPSSSTAHFEDSSRCRKDRQDMELLSMSCSGIAYPESDEEERNNTNRLVDKELSTHRDTSNGGIDVCKRCHFD